MSMRALETSDADAAVDVLVSAFAGDSLLVWAYGAREREGMRASTRMTVTLSTRSRAAFGHFEHGRLLAVALYQLPGEEPSDWQCLVAGFWRVPFAAGPRAALRIIRTFGHADALKARLIGGEPHYYLDIVGVHRDAAGRGIGQQLVQSSLATLRERAARPGFLLTHQPHNERLYQRLGFETVGQVAVPDSPATFWGMRQRIPE